MTEPSPSAAWPPGVAIIPIRQDEAHELAAEVQHARRFVSGSPDSRAVLDRVQNVLRAAITLTDVAPFAVKADQAGACRD